jgi:S-adenosylmethionine hydrolase
VSAPLVTLTTDFGSVDGYLGAMKGVILARCPDARLVDLAHEIARGDVAAAAFALGASAPYFPAGTVHLVVVDPGVGSARRALACAIGAQRFVAPDNGVLSRVLARGEPVRAVALERSEHWRPEPSPVFHGRDVFGPVAGALAAGAALESLGPEVASADLVRAPWPEPRLEGGLRVGAIMHVDRFGNLVSSVELRGPARGTAEVAGRRVGGADTYSDAAAGALVALRGSSGLLEIAVNGGSAAAVLGVSRGAVVTWRPA